MVKEELSLSLTNCINGDCKLQLRYDPEDDCFVLPWYYHGLGGYYLFFDPWTGKELWRIYDYDYLDSYEDSVEHAKRLLKNEELLEAFGKELYLNELKSAQDNLEEFLKAYGPVNSKMNRKYWDHKIEQSREQHLEKDCCDSLLDLLKKGDREGESPVIHIPSVRTYAILNKKEYGGFEPMDYCPFCGAKFPDRLDDNVEYKSG
ncbi:MAG: hypothetical protein LBI61_01245 [Puniceicoccales bacterium]|jgi:hypothetical protein|nr:hypothetical protein [Puniceicoccales bacterium]